MVTKDLLKLNTWLVDEVSIFPAKQSIGRIKHTSSKRDRSRPNRR